MQNTIASAVEEQTATTNEISRNVNEAARGSSEIAENIGGVADASRGSGEAAASTLAAADQLAALARDLQRLVDGGRARRASARVGDRAVGRAGSGRGRRPGVCRPGPDARGCRPQRGGSHRLHRLNRALPCRWVP